MYFQVCRDSRVAVSSGFTVYECEVETSSSIICSFCQKASTNQPKMEHNQYIITMLIVCWNTFPPDSTKRLSTRNSIKQMIPSFIYFTSAFEDSFTKQDCGPFNNTDLYRSFPFLQSPHQSDTTQSVNLYLYVFSSRRHLDFMVL